jgi:pimeloyl-ACP methyl ester carboxylesterase
VILPGTGSDEVFVRAAFEGPSSAAGLRLVAPAPRHGALLAEHYLDALSVTAERFGPVVVGGISLGAHVAAEWAAAHPSWCAGLLAVLPGWHGDSTSAPGALAAAVSADAVADVGVPTALATATRDVPPWLADELDRAWRRAGADLVASLRVAVARPAPTLDVLRRIAVPAGVVGCVDDPVHPVEVAREWAAALPRATLRTITFAALGADRAALGHAALAGLTAQLGREAT